MQRTSIPSLTKASKAQVKDLTALIIPSLATLNKTPYSGMHKALDVAQERKCKNRPSSTIHTIILLKIRI